MHERLSKAHFDRDASNIGPRLIALREWVVHRAEYPVLDVSFTKEGRKTLRIRMLCDNWNEQPPSIELLEPDGRGLTAVPQGQTGVFNGSAHPITQKFFICMAGSREYHTHDGHKNDSWENYKGKGGYDLGGILGQLWSAWLKSQS